MSSKCKKCGKKTSQSCAECGQVWCKSCLKRVAVVPGQSQTRYVCLGCLAKVAAAAPRRKMEARARSSPVLGAKRQGVKLKPKRRSSSKEDEQAPGISLVTVYISDLRGELGKKGGSSSSLLVKARKSSSSRAYYVAASMGAGRSQQTQTQSGLTVINFNQALYFPVRSRDLFTSAEACIDVELKVDRSLVMSEDALVGRTQIPIRANSKNKGKAHALELGNKILSVSVGVMALQGPWDHIAPSDVLALCSLTDLNDDQTLQLVNFVRWYDSTYESRMVVKLMDREIALTRSAIQLFRVDSTATRSLSKIFRYYAPSDFYRDLRVILRGVLRRGKGLELDAARVSSPRDMEEEADALCSAVDKILQCCSKHFPTIDVRVKQVLDPVWVAISKQFDESVATKTVVGSVFLRWVCPVIITPESNGILRADEIQGFSRRSFILITKLIQCVANGTAESEVFSNSQVVTDFIIKSQEKVAGLCNSLRNTKGGAESDRLDRIVRDGVESTTLIDSLVQDNIEWPPHWRDKQHFEVAQLVHPVIGPFCPTPSVLLARVPVSSWRHIEIGMFLLSLEFAEYVKLFYDAQVTGEMLALHKSNDVFRRAGVAKLGHRKRLQLNLDKYLKGK